MPTLKQLIEELERIRIDPDNVRLPGTVHDSLLEQAEEQDEDED